MKRFTIEDLYDVAEEMFIAVGINKKEEVMFVGKYDEAITVIKELIMFDEVMPYDIEICPEEIDWYEKEYYITLDANMNIWCEPAWRNDKYLWSTADVLFIMNDCNSSILHAVDSEESVEVAFNDEENDEYPECGECCGKCYCMPLANK